MHPKTEQNRSSTLGPHHLNSMDILKKVFPSKVFSISLLTTSWILISNSLIYCQDLALRKDGSLQHVSPSLTTKDGVFVYQRLNLTLSGSLGD